MKVVNWVETEKPATNEIRPFLVTTLMSHVRERCGVTSGVIDTACARTLVGTRLLENFEVELKKRAIPVEVVPDNGTFRFGPGAIKKSSRAVIYGCSGEEHIPFEGQPSRRGGSVIDQYESGEAIRKSDRCGTEDN